MALTLSAKAAGEVVRYSWFPPLVDGDTIASYTLVETDCVIDSDSNETDSVAMFVSGGTAGTTGTIVATALTSDGETLTETLYLPIRASTNAAANTVGDVIAFALRPIVGMGESADAAESDQALEALNDMVAEWRIDGLDIGVAAPLTTDIELSVSDSFLSALKFNLRVRVADEYGYQLPAATIETAQRSKMLAANALFTPADLTFETALQQPRVITGIDDL